MTKAGFARPWRAKDEVYALAISPDGQTLAAAHIQGTIRLWDVAGQKAGALLRGHVGEVSGSGVQSRWPDPGLGRPRQERSRLWDPVTGQELLTLNGHKRDVQGIAFSPDGTIGATGSYNGRSAVVQGGK